MAKVISYAFVDGFTRAARADAIAALKCAIARADGVIVDFAFFGCEAIRLTAELDAGGLGVLRRELEQSGVEVFARSAAALDEAKAMHTAHRIMAMLHVTFVAEAELAAPA